MRTTLKILWASLALSVFHVSAADEPKALGIEKTKALLSQGIGKIDFPQETLEKRIVALRAIAYRLGLKLTTSEGVDAVADKWTYPAITIEDGKLESALRHTADVTKLFYRIKEGEVHLLLIHEMGEKPIKRKEEGQRDAPSNGAKPPN
jgi:hypothetical protein